MENLEKSRLEEEIQALRKELREVKDLLKDLIFVASVDATETMQVTENTSAILRGEVPGGCTEAHARLRENIVGISSKWSEKETADLKRHLFGHEKG